MIFCMLFSLCLFSNLCGCKISVFPCTSKYRLCFFRRLTTHHPSQLMDPNWHYLTLSTINRSRRKHITSGYLQTDCILRGKTLSVFMDPVNRKELPLPSIINRQSSTINHQPFLSHSRQLYDKLYSNRIGMSSSMCCPPRGQDIINRSLLESITSGCHQTNKVWCNTLRQSVRNWRKGFYFNFTSSFLA